MKDKIGYLINKKGWGYAERRAKKVFVMEGKKRDACNNK